MELMEAIRTRRAVRDYEDIPVSEEKLRNVLEAARLAPSASNRQRWKFIIVRDLKRRRELSIAAGGQVHLIKAPIVIAAVATYPEYVMRCGVPAYAVDLAIAMDHLTLAAVNEGLGTCWVGAFSQDEARNVLGVPKNYCIVALMPLGFPKEESKIKTRKSFAEIVCYETFQE